MKSPSRQCALEPFAFPLTQFLTPFASDAPFRIAVLPPPAHCCSVGAAPLLPIGPFVHWLNDADVPLAVPADIAPPGTSSSASNPSKVSTSVVRAAEREGRA